MSQFDNIKLLSTTGSLAARGMSARLRSSSGKRKFKELEQARLKATLSRAQAAALLGVDSQHYSAAEDGGHGDPDYADWPKRFESLHGGIDVPSEATNTPEWIRKLRLVARLTKEEAATVVGIETAIGWHAYELGRYSLSAERWEVFLQKLRNGSFRDHVTAADRRGPRISPSGFSAGRLWVPELKKEKRKRAPVDSGACLQFSGARKALRLSAQAMSALIGAGSTTRVYNIEASRTQPEDAEINAIKQALVIRAAELEAMSFDINTGADIAAGRKALRLSQDEVGQKILPHSNRPGASISLYEGDKGVASASRTAKLSVYFERCRNDQLREVREVLLR